MSPRARDVLSERVRRVDAAVPIDEVMGEMRRQRVSHVAVFAQGKCLGVSSCDEADSPAGERTLEELVQRQRCPVVSETTSIEQLVRSFSDSRVDAQVVHDEQDEVVGVVTRQSLLEALLEKNGQTREVKQNSEERLERAIRGSADGFWDWDITTNEVWQSPRFLELLGYADDEPPKSFADWESWLHSDDRSHTCEALRRHLEENERYDVEYRMRTKDGGYRWFRSRGEAVRDQTGRATRMSGSHRDITDRKQAEKLLQAIVEGTVSATGAEFFSSFVSVLARIFESRYVIVCEHLDSPATRVRTLAFWMADHLGKNVEYDLAGGPCEEAAMGEMTFYPSGLQEIFPENTDLVDLGAESYCGLPLTDSCGQLIGHLAIMDDGPLGINLCEVPALQIFVSRAAAELERNRMERALRESELRLKTVISSAPLVITSIDQNGEIDLFDGRALESVGFEPGQFVGRDYYELWKDHPHMPRSMRESLAGETPAPTTMDIGNRLLETRYSPVKSADGQVTGAITVCIDVTERMQVEEELRCSEQRFRSVFEQAGLALGVVESETGQFLRINRRYEDLIGYSKEELTGKTWMEITHPDDIQGDREKMDALIAGEISEFTMEKRLIHKDGSVIWVNLTVSPIWNREEASGQHIAIVQDITERKRVESALRDSELRNRTLLEGSPVCTKIIDLDSRLQYMSAAGQNQLDIPDIEPFYGCAFPPDLYPEWTHGPVADHLERAKAGETSSLECPVRDTHGVEVWYDTTFVPSRNKEGQVEYVIVTSVNITERKQAEEELRRYEHIVSTSMDMLALLDENFVYLAANRAYLNAFGLAPDDLVGRSASDIFGEKVFETVIKPVGRRCLAGEHVSFQEWYKFPEYGRAYIDVNYYPYLNRDNEVEGFVVNVRDITERKRVEEEASRHRDELAHVTRISTMGEMATGIAHELNQPLAAISLYSDVARTFLGRSDSSPQEVQEILGKLEDQAIRAGAIVRRLRDYVKKTEPARMPVDLNTLVQDVAKLVEPDIRKAEAVLVLLTPQSSPSVLIDEIQIQQVLVNLIRNAIDAMEETPPGQRKVTVAVRMREDGQSEVAVSDTGKGLAENDLDQVFGAFFSTKQGGMGMGLPISRSIVEAHGGRLWAEADCRLGATFGFTLPPEERHAQ